MTNTPFDPSTAETWEALARYVSGESSEQEAAALRAWLRADPQRNDLLETMRQTLARMGAPPAADVDVERALQQVRARMQDAAVIPLPVAPPRQRWPAYVLRAAVFVLLIAGSLVVWRISTLDIDTPELVVRSFTTTIGQMDTVQLADGSTVVLGPASELRIADDYNRDTRTVTLRGVAMFDVHHDDARPFVVHAGGAQVRDLGTVFTVWHDEDDDDVRVAVSEGVVMLQHGNDGGIVLNAGDRGAIRDSTASAERGTASAQDHAWTRGQLVFTETSLSDVAIELRRWYGIQLRIPDAALRGRHVTATFHAHESAQQVLDVLAAVLGARVRLRGDTAVLSAGAQ